MSLAKDELRQEVAALKKRRIFEAARKLFYARGYQGTTLDDVAQALDVTKPFIYTYYPGKAHILYEICAIGTREALRMIEEGIAEGETPEESLRLAIRKTVLSVAENAFSVKVYQREEKSLDPARAAEIRAMRERIDHLVADLLAAGQAAGQFASGDPMFLARQIGAMISWIPTWYREENGGLQRTDLADRMVEAVQKLTRP